MRLFVMGAALALTGCSMGQDITDGDKAVVMFHRQFNAGQIEAIVSAAGPEMHQGGIDGRTFLDTMRRKLGAFKSTSRTGFNDNYNNGDHTIALTYASTYATGPATENFLYRLSSGKPVLIGYHVESAALLK